MSCGHDERYDFECPECRRAMRQDALDAGIPASVFDGKTKLSDHFPSAQPCAAEDIGRRECRCPECIEREIDAAEFERDLREGK
jgi:hypothetical protein